MTFSRFAPVLALAAALSAGACVSTPVYAPQTSDYGSGYSDKQLDRTHYSVSFAGRRSSSRDTVEAGLLLRAAEVTQAAGYSHFIIDTRQTAQEIRPGAGPYPYGPGWGWGPGWGDPFYHGRFGFSRFGLYDPFWYDFNTFDNDTRFVATATITLTNSANEPHAISARDVIANLGPQFAPPAAAAPR